MGVTVVVAHLVVVQAIGVAFEHLPRFVVRAAVLDDVLEPRIVLVDDAPNRAVDEVALVVGGRDDRDHRRVLELDLPRVAAGDLELLGVVVVEPAKSPSEESVANPGLGAAHEAGHPQPEAANANPQRLALAGPLGPGRCLGRRGGRRLARAAKRRRHGPEGGGEDALGLRAPPLAHEHQGAHLGDGAMELGDLGAQRLELTQSRLIGLRRLRGSRRALDPDALDRRSRGCGLQLRLDSLEPRVDGLLALSDVEDDVSQGPVDAVDLRRRARADGPRPDAVSLICCLGRSHARLPSSGARGVLLPTPGPATILNGCGPLDGGSAVTAGRTPGREPESPLAARLDLAAHQR